MCFHLILQKDQKSTKWWFVMWDLSTAHRIFLVKICVCLISCCSWLARTCSSLSFQGRGEIWNRCSIDRSRLNSAVIHVWYLENFKEDTSQHWTLGCIVRGHVQQDTWGRLTNVYSWPAKFTFNLDHTNLQCWSLHQCAWYVGWLTMNTDFGDSLRSEDSFSTNPLWSHEIAFWNWRG